MYVYCLFCQTQRCKLIAALLEQQGACRAFSPQILQRERKQGKNVEMLRDLLPGYVFLYAESPLQPEACYPGVRGVIRRLGSAEHGYELTGSDYDFAMRLYERGGQVNAVRVLREGDQVVLTDPLFNGCQGRISRIDYRKQRARVEFDFEKSHCHTWVAFELISEAEGA